MSQLEEFKTAALALAEVAEHIAGKERLNPCAVIMLLANEAKGLVGDGRKSKWRARVRFYSATDDFQEPIADTDPDLPPDAPGVGVLNGLSALVDWISQLGVEIHGQQPNGLSTESLDHRLKSFRPTLSRNNGTGVWRVSYTTLETIGGHQVEKAWKFRADVQTFTPKEARK